ncbi:MAG: 23S rRNA (pseudouridine(1915)-N(3))-methyltransferase RlmH [Pseudobdellovibrionaceae bacterium]
MKIVVLSIQSSKEKWFDLLKENYSEKIGHFCSFEIKELKAKSMGRDERVAKRKAETEALLAEIKNDDLLISLDEKGQNVDSIQFSKSLNQAMMSGKKRLVFVIGGAYGIEQTLLAKSQHVLSLSPFVLNHRIAQSVLLEQIYRGFAILKNLPYHNE